MNSNAARAVMVAGALLVWGLLAPTHRAEALEPARVNGSGSALDMMKPLLRAYTAAHPDDRFVMGAPLGSSGAMKALLGEALDLAVISRPVTPEESAQGANARFYGRTPLLVVTHRSVAKEDITTEELEEIYSGRRPVWPDGQRIRIVLRPEKDTVTKILRGLSPRVEAAEAAARKQPWAVVAVTDPESNERVASTRSSLGAATLTSVVVTQLPLHVLSLDGVAGTTEALARGRYPLAQDLIFVTTPGSSAVARAIVDFALSAQGRAIAERSGVLVGAPAELAR